MQVDGKKYKSAVLVSLLLSLFLTFCLTAAILFVFIDKEVDFKLSFIPLFLLPPSLYFYFMRKYFRRRNILKNEFPLEFINLYEKNVAWYSTLNEVDKKQLHRDTQIFLAEKEILGIETEVTNLDRILIAASALIPVFKFPDWEYDNVTTILLYPARFNIDFDSDGKNRNILGLVGIGSSMVLSRPDLELGFKQNNDKLNVGFHEFIHKVDQKDGSIDGILAVLMNPVMITEWKRIVADEMNLLEKGKSDINPYGLSNKAEFFAVAAEYFFENPESMRKEHLELYNILVKIFKQDTVSMFSNVVKSLFKPIKKKSGRNSPCPCGSGKKFKYCCIDKCS